MKKLMTLSLIVTGVAFGAFAEGSDDINDRQEAMKNIAQSMKTLTPMAKGEVDFDADIALGELSTINMYAQELPDWFPEDSQLGHGKDGEDTEAAPAIWEKPDEFSAMLDKFIADTGSAVESNPQDADELAAAMGIFSGDCKTCHEDFRVKKN